MALQKKEERWIVESGMTKRSPLLFENKKEAKEYADILALKEEHSVITGVIEIEHPIVNNFWPIIELKKIAEANPLGRM